jgi:hypothetical protein
VLGQETTVEFSGTPDRAVSSGTVSLHIQAGPIKIAGDAPFALSPSVPASDIKVKLGPFVYPNVPVPIIKTVGGRVEIKDDQGEILACFAMQLPTSSLAGHTPALPDSRVDASWPSKCGSAASDHIKNLNVTSDPVVIKKGQSFTGYTAGDLDETVASGKITATINIVIAQLSLDIPFSITPAFTAQHYSLAVGPVKLPWIPLIPSVKGNLKAVDEKNEELFCHDFNMPVSELAADAAVVV